MACCMDGRPKYLSKSQRVTQQVNVDTMCHAMQRALHGMLRGRQAVTSWSQVHVYAKPWPGPAVCDFTHVTRDSITSCFNGPNRIWCNKQQRQIIAMSVVALAAATACGVGNIFAKQSLTSW